MTSPAHDPHAAASGAPVPPVGTGAVVPPVTPTGTPGDAHAEKDHGHKDGAHDHEDGAHGATHKDKKSGWGKRAWHALSYVATSRFGRYGGTLAAGALLMYVTTLFSGNRKEEAKPLPVIDDQVSKAHHVADTKTVEPAPSAKPAPKPVAVEEPAPKSNEPAEKPAPKAEPKPPTVVYTAEAKGVNDVFVTYVVTTSVEAAQTATDQLAGPSFKLEASGAGQRVYSREAGKPVTIQKVVVTDKSANVTFATEPSGAQLAAVTGGLKNLAGTLGLQAEGNLEGTGLTRTLKLK